MKNMFITIEITRKITIDTELGKFLSLTFDSNDKCIKLDSNFPYEKNIEDWKLYIKMISKIIKEMEGK